jgi:hypothetical protein
MSKSKQTTHEADGELFLIGGNMFLQNVGELPAYTASHLLF